MSDARRCACTTPPGGPSCRSSPAEHVLMYTCGITPYDATHLGHAATFLAYDVLQRRLHRPRPHRHVRAQRHRRRRPAVRQGPPARRPLPRPGGRGGGPVRGATWRRSTRCPSPRRRGRRRRSPTSAASSAWCSTAASPTRPAARCTSTSARFDAFGSVSHYDRGEMLDLAARAGRRRRQPGQAPPARLRAVAAVGAPTSRRGTRCGGRAGRAGTSSAAPSPCASWARRSTSTAAAPT